MYRRLLTILALATLLGMLLMLTLPALGSGAGEGPSQTWPSRTPTPSGGQPPGPQPTGTQQPPEPTGEASPQPGSTPQPASGPAVSSPGAGLPGDPSPSSGQGETAGQTEGSAQLETGAIQLPPASEIGTCGLPPIAIAQGPINVRSGPGIEFPTVAELAFQQERVVVGRAANATWWQILLTVEQLGWVSDQAVAISGYTGAVPITSEDLVEGVQPLWNPTPNPLCTRPSQEEILISDDRLAAAIAAAGQSSFIEPPPTPEPDSGAGAGLTSPGFSVLQPDEGAMGMSMIWLPIVGAFLIIAGGIALLVQRRRY